MILRSMKRTGQKSLNQRAVQLSGLRQQSEGPGRGRKGRRKGPIVPLKGRGIAGKEVPIGYRMNGDSNMLTISGGNDEGVPPVPIPNTEVKPFSADGTWLVTARESRSPPDSIFLSSSMAEHSAVNRRVVGSSPTWGAKKPGHKTRSFCIPQVKYGGLFKRVMVKSITVSGF